ncbi:MAG: hypothetical protein IAE65_08155 [Ignavibacteria bacterium]|nr:hypothetical protein [Ignavibacteria bacterium]
MVKKIKFGIILLYVVCFIVSGSTCQENNNITPPNLLEPSLRIKEAKFELIGMPRLKLRFYADTSFDLKLGEHVYEVTIIINKVRQTEIGKYISECDAIQKVFSINSTGEYDFEILLSEFAYDCQQDGLYQVDGILSHNINNKKESIAADEVQLPFLYRNNLSQKNEYIEYDYVSETGYSTYISSIKRAISNSFLFRNVNINLIDVSNNISINSKLNEIGFNYEDDEDGERDLDIRLNTTAFANKRIEYVNDGYHLLLYKFCYAFQPGNPQNKFVKMLGISHGTDLIMPPNNTSYDWSFVFVENNKSSYPFHILKQNSNINRTSVHELVHQSGHLWHHDMHQGDLRYKCVLNTLTNWITYNGDFHPNYELQFFNICNYHSERIRNRIFDSSTLNVNSSQNVSSPLLEISTEKTTFKEHEPIEILIKYINNSNKIDTLFSIDSYGATTIDFEVKNLNGDILKSQRNKPTFLDNEPKFILQPNDTLIFTLSINNWYGVISKHKNKLNKNYFPEGEYFINARLPTNFGENYIYSNEIKVITVPNDEKDYLKMGMINSNYKSKSEKIGDGLKMYHTYNFNSSDLELINADEPFSSYIYSLFGYQLILSLNNEEISIVQFINTFFKYAKKYKNSVYNELLIKFLFNTLKYKKITLDHNFLSNVRLESEDSLLNYLLYYNYKNIYLK